MPRVTFIEPGGKRHELDVPTGLTLLDVARRHDIDIEGACDGCLSCTTCHVIVEEEYFELLPPATEEEEDMLDLAWGLTPTSRLGCQVVVNEEADGLVVHLPAETADAR